MLLRALPAPRPQLPPQRAAQQQRVYLDRESYLAYFRAGGSGDPLAQAARFIAYSQTHSLALAPPLTASSIPLRLACAADAGTAADLCLDLDMLCFCVVVRPLPGASNLFALLERAVGPGATFVDSDTSLRSPEMRAILDVISSRYAQFAEAGIDTGAPCQLGFTKHSFFSPFTTRGSASMLHALPPRRLVAVLPTGSCCAGWGGAREARQEGGGAAKVGGGGGGGGSRGGAAPAWPAWLQLSLGVAGKVVLELLVV